MNVNMFFQESDISLILSFERVCEKIPINDDFGVINKENVLNALGFKNLYKLPESKYRNAFEDALRSFFVVKYWNTWSGQTELKIEKDRTFVIKDSMEFVDFLNKNYTKEEIVFLSSVFPNENKKFLNGLNLFAKIKSLSIADPVEYKLPQKKLYVEYVELIPFINAILNQFVFDQDESIVEKEKKYLLLLKELEKESDQKIKLFNKKECDFLVLNETVYEIKNNKVKISQVSDYNFDDSYSVLLKRKTKSTTKINNSRILLKENNSYGLIEVSRLTRDFEFLLNQVNIVDEVKRQTTQSTLLINAEETGWSFLSYTEFDFDEYMKIDRLVFDLDQDLFRINYVDRGVRLKDKTYIAILKNRPVFDEHNEEILEKRKYLIMAKETAEFLKTGFGSPLQLDYEEINQFFKYDQDADKFNKEINEYFLENRESKNVFYSDWFV